MSYHVSKYLDDIKTSCLACTSAGADHALCLYFAKLAYEEMIVHLKAVHGVEGGHKVRVK
jgi:hypothetical protein